MLDLLAYKETEMTMGNQEVPTGEDERLLPEAGAYAAVSAGLAELLGNVNKACWRSIVGGTSSCAARNTLSSWAWEDRKTWRRFT
jgi:hypothetical protein